MFSVVCLYNIFICTCTWPLEQVLYDNGLIMMIYALHNPKVHYWFYKT